MDKSFLKKAVTLNDNDKWFICDETEQDGNKYYLAVKLNSKNEPEEESKIFKEVKSNDKVYLDDDIDLEIYKYLVAIFVTNFNNNSEKIIEELNIEETE